MATNLANKPKVLVFDLDYTLWPFWVDTHVHPPFRKISNGSVVDMVNQKIKFYPEVPLVLKNLHEEGYLLATASRTSEIRGAHQLIDLFGWRKYFNDFQIYPGCKVKHLTKIKNNLDVEFKDIIFFDDESRNIKDATEIGVRSVYVRDGITKKVIDDALNEFAKQ